MSFCNPMITPFSENEVKTMKEVMYFYYDVNLLKKNKLMKTYEAYDFPKVQNLPAIIDYIMNFNMENAFKLRDIEDENGFIGRVLYNQVILDDGFGLDVEYFYKIERYDNLVKQAYEDTPQEWTEYVLTVGQMESNRKGGSIRDDFGEVIMIKNISPEELKNLKEIASSFCEAAINEYNEVVLPLELQMERESEEMKGSERWN